jgi:hypothetical protein
MGILWPPSNPETRALLGSIVNPVATHFAWLLFALVFMLWLANLIPVIRAGQIMALRDDIGTIRKTLDRYVSPRHLTTEQISTIASYLSQHDEHHIKFRVVWNDNEAGNYRGDLQQALQRGGWIIDGIDTVQDTPNSYVPEGLSIQTETPMSMPQPDPKHPLPGVLLRDAFKQARVQLDGGSGSSGSGAINTYSVTLSVGHRRRDGYGYGSPELVMKMVPEE